MKSVYDAIKFLVTLTPNARTASEDGSAIDTTGFGSAALVISAGSVDTADGDESYVFHIEESEDGSTGWTPIADTEVEITETDEVQLVRLEGLNTGSRKPYLRASLVIGGTTPSIACSAVFALGRPYNEPVN